MGHSDKSEKADELREIFVNTTGVEEVTETGGEEDTDRVVNETETRPTASVNCPDCGNDRAYYDMRQIRSADESETRFFECTECGKRWRENDH